MDVGSPGACHLADGSTLARWSCHLTAIRTTDASVYKGLKNRMARLRRKRLTGLGEMTNFRKKSVILGG
jgi:hypothetical protein